MVAALLGEDADFSVYLAGEWVDGDYRWRVVLCVVGGTFGADMATALRDGSSSCRTCRWACWLRSSELAGSRAGEIALAALARARAAVRPASRLDSRLQIGRGERRWADTSQDAAVASRPLLGETLPPAGTVVVSNQRGGADVAHEGYAEVRVDRSTPLGNPFKVSTESLRDPACEAYVEYISDPVLADVNEIALRRGLVVDSRFATGPAVGAAAARAMEQLEARLRAGEKLNLRCWCAPLRCHGNAIADALSQRLEVGAPPRAGSRDASDARAHAWHHVAPHRTSCASAPGQRDRVGHSERRLHGLYHRVDGVKVAGCLHGGVDRKGQPMHDPPGMGGVLYGRLWQYAFSAAEIEVVTIPVAEFMAAVVGLMVYDSVGALEYAERICLEVDAEATPRTALQGKAHRPGLLIAHDEFTRLKVYGKYKSRLMGQHVFGAGNEGAGKASRSRNAEAERLVRFLGLEPRWLPLPAEAHSYKDAVVKRLRDIQRPKTTPGTCDPAEPGGDAPRFGSSPSPPIAWRPPAPYSPPVSPPPAVTRASPVLLVAGRQRGSPYSVPDDAESPRALATSPRSSPPVTRVIAFLPSPPAPHRSSRPSRTRRRLLSSLPLSPLPARPMQASQWPALPHRR